MNVGQFRGFVVRPTLYQLGLWSLAAENLLVGTAIHESGGLNYIDQVTGPGDTTLGPAYGLYQIEEATLNDLFDNFLKFRPRLAEMAIALEAPMPKRVLQLVTNLAFATAVARLIYYRAPDPLPGADDIPGLAACWKKNYNTVAGKGRVEDWIAAYRRLG